MAIDINKYRPAEHAPFDRNMKTEAQLKAVADTFAGYKARKVAAPKIDPDTYQTDWVRGQRPAFEEMQRTSRRAYLHLRGFR